MEKLEYKQVATTFEVKKEGGNLYIEGYAAKFGNVDSYNDIIRQGAFALFLTSEDAKRVRLCYQHDFDNVIGVIESMSEDEQGLKFRAKISNTTLGKDVATLLEDGAINEFSIGYKTVKFTMDDQQNIRTLEEVYLYEISPVTRAANEQATLQASERKEDNNTKKDSKEMEEEIKKLQADLAEAMKAKGIAEKALAESAKVKDLEEKTEGYKADIENLDASIKQMSAQIEKLSKSTEGKSFEKVLAETFNSDEFKNGLKEVVEGKRVSYKSEVKTYTGLDSADLTGTVNLTMPNTQVEADAQKKLVLLGSVPTYTVPQDKAIIMWPEGAFTDQTAYVAEGTASSVASSAALEEKTRLIAKVAAFLPFSRETSTDMSYFLNWAKNEAILAIRNKVDTEMLSGLGADTDSTTQKKIYGLIGSSTAFDATAAGVNGAIAGAQIFDLLNAIDSQISLGTNDAYQANLILMNPSDFAKYRSLKDNNGALLFQSNGGVYSYMGKTVKQTAKLAAGKMIVLDTAALQMYEKLGFEVEIERVASTDSYVMYLRWRGQFVVPANKKKAVIYVDNIGTAIAAITGADTKLSMGVVAVSGLTAESAQAASAKLSWPDSGTGVKYKSSTDNVNWGADITDLFLEFDDLTPNTDYTYYIKAVKAGMIDSDSQVVSFKTAAYTAQ